ncbi:hypothetical protein L873DRAFT_1140514 [Choiromyces venosus 120613-1]|uniref:Uncharacterized protein n=1 Tax=Choiromyces venosus 120613-1 TaxID=1336337 RepID=A0A3N4JU44_9PEZI|nr:hypothetical protein L873DRAFT_1140514 [Choiromyces venosus 120613-1]
MVLPNSQSPTILVVVQTPQISSYCWTPYSASSAPQHRTHLLTTSESLSLTPIPSTTTGGLSSLLITEDSTQYFGSIWVIPY